MLPNIQPHNRRPPSLSHNSLAKQRTVLILRSNNPQLLPLQNQPTPPRPKHTRSLLLKLRLERIHTPKRLLDRFFQRSLEFGARLEAPPEEAVVRMAAALVTDGFADVFGDGLQFGYEVVDRES